MKTIDIAILGALALGVFLLFRPKTSVASQPQGWNPLNAVPYGGIPDPMYSPNVILLANGQWGYKT